MRGTIASLWRHPIKGLTPESLDAVDLEVGAYFPNDRVFAVEVGPSGFDPEHPRHISKLRFAVLARFPELARLKTRLDDETGSLFVGDESGFGVDIPFGQSEGRAALARYLQAYLGSEADQPLRVLQGSGGRSTPGGRQHHFMDNCWRNFRRDGLRKQAGGRRACDLGLGDTSDTQDRCARLGRYSREQCRLDPPRR